MVRSIFVLFFVQLLSGCSHETWLQVEQHTNMPGFVAPFLVPVNLAARIGLHATDPGNDRVRVDPEMRRALVREQGEMNRRNEGSNQWQGRQVWVKVPSQE